MLEATSTLSAPAAVKRVAVLARLVDLELVSVVFDRTDPVAALFEQTDHLLDQSGLSGPGETGDKCNNLWH